MKLHILLLLSIIANIAYGQDKAYFLQFKNKDKCENIPISVIDSITFSINAESEFIQKVWRKGDSFNTSVNLTDTTSVLSQDVEYRILNKETEGYNAFITNEGNFCMIKDSVNEQNSSIAIIGNSFSDKKTFVLIDSCGLIQNIIDNGMVYSVFYGTDSLSIYKNDNRLCNIGYEDFSFEDNTKTSRASIITRNPIFKLLNILNQIGNHLTDPIRNTIFDLLRSHTHGRLNNALLDFIQEQSDIDIITLLKWLDDLLDYYFLGNASIETLSYIKQSAYSYILSCSVVLPTSNIPYLQAYNDLGIKHSFNLYMQLRNTNIGGDKQTKEMVPNESKQYNFNFSDLDVHTIYAYEPRLEIVFELPGEAFRMSIDSERDKPIKNSKYIYGEEKEFMTPNIGCSVIKHDNITDKTADITCSYSNIPNNAQCGYKVFKQSDDKGFFVGNGSGDGEHTSTVSGLEPCTEYSYIACVKYKGKEYPSLNGGTFVTKVSDISGTWTCTEEYYFNWDKNYENPQYKDYPVILGKDGTVSIDGKSDYVSSSWSYGANGRLTIKIMDMATSDFNSGFDINLTADDAKAPKKFTGAINNWSFNSTVGYVSRGGHSVVLTR